jgi:hypothetical protein
MGSIKAGLNRTKTQTTTTPPARTATRAKAIIPTTIARTSAINRAKTNAPRPGKAKIRLAKVTHRVETTTQGILIITIQRRPARKL